MATHAGGPTNALANASPSSVHRDRVRLYRHCAHGGDDRCPCRCRRGNSGHGDDDRRDGNDAPVLLFVADGLRQDLVEQFAANRRRGRSDCRRWPNLLKKGASASGGGLLTQAPPNTGAGWYSLATGAWPGVHGSTNNTFHINGQPFANRTSAFDAGVLQAESIATVGRARRQEGHAVRVRRRSRRPAIQGPTVDFRSVLLRSRRGDELHLTERRRGLRRPRSGCSSTIPAGFAGQAPFPRAAPVDGHGLDQHAALFSPAKEMRLRVLDFGVDKYGLDAFIFDSTQRPPGELQQGAVLTDEGRRRRPSPRSAQGEWADIKVQIVRRRRSRARPPGFLIKVETLAAGPLPGAAVPHVGRPRDRLVADVARRARLHRRLRRVHRPDVPELDRRRLRRPRGGHRQRGDLHRAGSEVGDVRHPAPAVHHADVPARPRARRLPDDGRVPAPVPRPHQPDAAQRCAQPGLRRRAGQRHA